MTWFALNIILAFAFEYVLIFLHESGHVAAAKIAGMKILSVRLGYGRRLFKTRVFDIPVIFNSVPIIGLTAAIPSGPTRIRLNLWLLTVGGPLVHVLLFAAFLIVSPESYYLGYVLPKITSQIAPIEALLLANLWLFLFNVFPRELRTPVGKHYSDGYNLLKIPFMSDSEIDLLVRSLPRIEAYEFTRERSYSAALQILDRELEANPDDAFLRHDRATAEIHLGNFERARATLLSLLDAEAFAEKELNLLLQNNIAWLDAVIGDEAGSERAHRFSKSAFDHAPHLTMFCGTRGAVLVRYGNAVEGAQLLERSFKECADPDNRACEAVFIAFARAKQKRFDEARKWLSTARRESPAYPLTDAIAMEIRELELSAE